MAIPALPADELTQLAKDFAAGRVFCDRHCRSPDEVRSSFMLIALGGLAGMLPEDRQDIGLIYEYLDRAGPLAVNGNPTFLSLRLLNRADAVTLLGKVERIRAAVEAAAG